MERPTILIVEDEADIREGIGILLSGENYSILEAENGRQALSMMNRDIDLVILDVMMPGMSGFRVCEEIRKEYTVPILFLTARAQEHDKLIGLTAGGDDYLIKPFSFAELTARVGALLKRYHVYQGKAQAACDTESEDITLNGITISGSLNHVTVNVTKKSLTDTEYHILLTLMKNPQKVFSATQTIPPEIFKLNGQNPLGNISSAHIKLCEIRAGIVRFHHVNVVRRAGDSGRT